ncbi:MAG: hypothetical protein Q9162_006812 [Coniocarpon cinnabarinum]
MRGLNARPRRIAYLLAAVFLVGVFYYLSSRSRPQPRNSLQRSVFHKWTVADPHLQQTLSDQIKTADDTPTFLSEEDKVGTKQEEDVKSDSTSFNEAVFAFQDELTSYNQPKSFSSSSLSKLDPINLEPRAASHGPTFATYLCTRNSSTHDPYFLATEQLVYRTLWKHESASQKHYPFTVFVAPFISTEQRNLLSAAGANVVELPLVDWKPTVAIWARWRDLFSKLHMWNQTQFSLIAFLDSDAFPLQPLDDIFTVSTSQTCHKDRLTHTDDIRNANTDPYFCNFTFAGSKMMYIPEINVGVTVFNPNPSMHRRLLRESADPNNFDNNMAEQAFLNKYFSQDGPFPMRFIPREWNGFWANDDEEKSLKVVHEKLWAFTGNAKWAEGLFERTHLEMVAFYEGEEFLRRRKVEAGVKRKKKQ